jgi:YD repeat-containing protein
MNKIFIKCCIFLIISTSSYSQWKQTSYSIPSPNAAALGTYGEIPVSLFTGTPNISIPLYELKGNKIQLPISLSYHSAIRPDYHPGWTGIGWSLMCGGVITRKLNKLPDELQANGYGNLGYYFQYSGLNNAASWASSLSAPEKYPAGGADVEPDEFNFNFLGYSGKFFLDHTGGWRVQSDRALKVVFNNSDFQYPFIYNSQYDATGYWITKTFKQFTILDEEGNKYIFGNNENAIEYSDEIVPYGRDADLFFATSWFLSRIESADGAEVINLSYVRGPFTSYLYQGLNSMFVNASHAELLNPGCSNYNIAVKKNGRTISPVYLSAVDFPNQSVRIDFSASKSNDLSYSDILYTQVITDIHGFQTTNDYKILNYTQGLLFDDPNDQLLLPLYKRFIWRKLDAISIVNSTTNSNLKKISFNYTEDGTRRLRMNNVIVKDRSNAEVAKYQFSYNDNILLPQYLTKIGDHWGFNSNSSLPTSINNTDFFALRQPNDSYTKAEVLTRIIYPTGGYTDFEYELNKYRAYVSLDRQTVVGEVGDAGGLRIKKITSNDGIHQPLVKEYFYVKNYQHNSDPFQLESSGILDTKPKYTFSNLSGIDIGGISFTYSFTSSNPVIPLSQNSSGTHISYSEVVEKLSNNSYIIYKYSNHDNGYKDVVPVATYNRENVAFYPFSSRDFERGRLLNASVYKSNGKIVKEEIIEYSRINEVGKASRAVENSFFWGCNPSQSATRQAVSRSAYLFYYYPFMPSKQIVKEYSSNENSTHVSTTEKDIVYDDYKNIILETVKNSKGHIIQTEFKYPYHFSNVSSTQSNANIYSKMTGLNILNKIVEKKSFIFKGGVRYFTGADLSTYKEFFTGKIYTDKYYNVTVKEPASENYLIPTTFTNTPAELSFDPKFEQKLSYNYGTHGNVTEITKINDISNVYIWGYNSQYPVAKIINTTHNIAQSYITQSVLDAATGNGDDIALRSHLNNLRSISGALVTTYTYQPSVGMTSETDPNNRTVFYEYDLFNRLRLVRDKDGKIVKKICYNYFGQPDPCSDAPNWQVTGNTRCKPCPANSVYSTNILQNETKDINPNSPTYNQLQWVDAGVSNICGIANWQNQGAPYCELDLYNGNTGNLLQLQKDMNPCSLTFNQLQVVLLGYYPQSCPVICSAANCYSEGFKCINGNCEQGYKIYTAYYCDPELQSYVHVYHYEWSDGTWSQNFYELEGGSWNGCPN